MTMHEKYAAHFALVLTQLSFSGWHIVSSIVLKDGADPVIFALYREITASVLMFSFVKFKNLPVVIVREDLPRFLFIGVCSFVNVVFTILALQYISPTRYALFQPTIPCIAAVISIFLKLEPFSLIKAGGIVLSVGGAIIVEAWKPNGADSEDESNVQLGLILVVLQCTAMANIIVMQKPLLSKYDPALTTFVYYTVGSVVTLLLCICWEFRFTATSFYFDSKWKPWVGLAYASIFATLMAYNFYSWAGKKLVPSITTVYCTLQPVATALLSFIVFQSVVTINQAVGGAVVIFGLFVTVYGRHKELDDQSKFDGRLQDDDSHEVALKIDHKARVSAVYATLLQNEP